MANFKFYFLLIYVKNASQCSQVGAKNVFGLILNISARTARWKPRAGLKRSRQSRRRWPAGGRRMRAARWVRVLAQWLPASESATAAAAATDSEGACGAMLGGRLVRRTGGLLEAAFRQCVFGRSQADRGGVGRGCDYRAGWVDATRLLAPCESDARTPDPLTPPHETPKERQAQGGLTSFSLSFAQRRSSRTHFPISVATFLGIKWKSVSLVFDFK